MRKINRSGSFMRNLLLTMLLHVEGWIPATVLLVLHFVWKWSVWWSVLAAGLWIAWLIFWMLFIGWAGRCGNTPDAPKENKNPYSAGSKK